jgi:hypothetical protein
VIRPKMLSAKMATIAVSTALSLSPALAQSGQPGLYAYHTDPAVGGCPGLDWQINVGADNSLTGFVAWDHEQHVAKLVGSIKKDRTFEMEAQEVGGAGRKATVKGSAGGNNISISISGIENPCDGVILNVPRTVAP